MSRNRTLLLVLLSALVHPGFCQDSVEPKWDIPPSIAKLPERSDFYGDWLRFDGSYRFMLEPGEGEGSIVARYFNPDPVAVESAEFSEQEGLLLLTIVLRDEGYDGSTYRLMFMPERRILVGEYRMPGSQPFEVYFVAREP